MRSALNARNYPWDLLKQQRPSNGQILPAERIGLSLRSALNARNSIKRETRAGRVAEDSAKTTHNEARRMLDAFASVGATQFDVTWTTRSGDKDEFRRGMQIADLARTMPALLDAAITRERNLIVRPHGPGIAFLQLDDLAADRLPAIAPAVFLALETSPGNFQAWLALPGSEDKEFARRVRRGTGADATASGATRVAGSLNFKDKYAPDFPRVKIHAAQPGRMTNPPSLSGLGWSRRRKNLRRCMWPLPARSPAATANGRATQSRSTARRSTARKPAPMSAGRISCGA